MKKLLLLSTIAASTFAAGYASADDHNENGYIGVSAGVVNMWDNVIGGAAADYDNGYNLNVSLGYDWDRADAVRPEIELSYKDSDLDSTSGDVQQYSAMANFYYDFENESRYTPYLGLGAGVSYVEADSATINDDDTVFAYQAMAGADLEINETVDLTMQYKYHNAYEVDIANVEEDVESNNIEIGLRFKY